MKHIKPSFHMTSEEFRAAGRDTIDWIAHYYETVEGLPVLSQVTPGEIYNAIPNDPPIAGEPISNVLADLDKVVLPGITHWQSPHFHAYFPSNSSGPSVLGDLVSSGLGVQGMLWATSPACTEVEMKMLDWLVHMLDLPRHFLSSSMGGGVIQDSASSASLCALLAARECATGGESNEDGCRMPLVAYASTQAHSHVEKDIKVAGIGRKNLRLIDVDEKFAMRPQALERAIVEDKAAGKLPFFVCATIGTTSSLAIDPVREIAAICRKHGLWLHVDAAMAGSAALCPELRWTHTGVELADSYAFNPHKWMFTNFDCTAFYVKNRNALINSLSVVPEYLRNQASEEGSVIDYRDWHVPLGRRFRALKLWFVIRHYGIEGLQFHIRQHVAWAQEFAGWVAEDPRFEIVAPHPLNLVCFRLRSGDEANERLLKRLNESGKLYLSHTRLDGKFTLRFSIGQTRTERQHVESAWKQVVESID
jgi:aromatic-L-amino-acid/L-tryptophan decarboxylase